MNKITRLSCFVVVLAAMGCGDDNSNRCDGVPETDRCETAGALQCSTDGTTVQNCAADANGCLVWTAVETCGVNETCTATGDTPACACVDACAAGESECRGSVVWACRADADGCLAWVAGEDCADTGKACVQSGATAECSSACTPDCTTAGDTRCSGTVIQTCTDVGSGCLMWQEGTDCADRGQLCDDTAEPAVCVASCTPDCTTAGDTRCNAVGDAIETCTDVDGCLLWQETTDCTTVADYCDAASGTATCVSCTNLCTAAGETQCDGTVIETCTADLHGCLDWAAGTDCAATGQECDDSTEPATCVEPQGTGSCADPIVVRVDHYALGGTDFTADFTDDQTLSDASCDSRTGTVDAVFSIDLAAGETVRLRQLGSLDAVLSLQKTCGDASACEFSEDSGEVEGHDYTATVNERVYLIVEAYFSSPSNLAYDIRIDIVSAEDCGNGVDDDADGYTDCDDPDCFGEATHCTTETNCGDGEDNDADGSTDCDDSDCAAAPACAPYRAVYEAFVHDTDPFDLEGQVLTFTPSATDPMDYTWAVTAGTGDYLVTPGTGTATSTPTLGDDTSVSYAFTVLPSFTFYGTAYTSMHVGSNGHLTFGSGYAYPLNTARTFFAQPAIVTLGEDLNPAASGAGAVTVDEFADRVAVTFHDVPFYGATVHNRFQTVLHADGRIQFAWVAVPAAGFDAGDTPYVGIASGVGRTPYPAETDFYTPPPEECGSGIDEDGDTLIDCDDPDCFGDATHCTTEANCGDGEDNDADGNTDCADSDCTFAAACGPRINEVGYDQPGSYTTEFVELYAPASFDLSGYTLVHLNGSDGNPLWAADLTGRTVPADRFWVLGSSAMTGLTDAVWADFGVADSNAMQNDVEALVLYWHYRMADERVVDAVAWKGTASLPPFAIEGTPAVGIPTPAWGNTMGRYVDGNDTDDNRADFVQSWWPTPGEANTPAQPAGFHRVTASVTAGASPLPAAIPDDDPTGIALTLPSGSHLGTTIAEVHIGVRIRHTFRGDLVVSVTSPAGTTVRLHNRTGFGADDLMTVYSLATTPDQPLTVLAGEDPTGTWTLNVSDNDPRDTGSVLEWVVWVRE